MQSRNRWQAPATPPPRPRGAQRPRPGRVGAFLYRDRRPRGVRLHRGPDGVPALQPRPSRSRAGADPGRCAPPRRHLSSTRSAGPRAFLPTRSTRSPTIEAAATCCRQHGIEIVRGIGKHGPGENLFLVFKDPDGNYVGVLLPTWCRSRPRRPYQPRVWDNDLDAFDQWHFEALRRAPAGVGPEAVSAGESATGPGDSRGAWRGVGDPAIAFLLLARGVGEVGRHLPASSTTCCRRCRRYWTAAWTSRALLLAQAWVTLAGGAGRLRLAVVGASRSASLSTRCRWCAARSIRRSSCSRAAQDRARAVDGHLVRLRHASKVLMAFLFAFFPVVIATHGRTCAATPAAADRALPRDARVAAGHTFRRLQAAARAAPHPRRMQGRRCRSP